ncbi:uncharacterized protein B0T15DRAFT_535554 [Chaetomium strumarium]|uniref:Uncharacterized protein n=1 Tax=Chaetomium strumarium TaxID=1170767 RepID=A0AAJ0GQA5_9PEZI|nr:hypothetical protein B0T15DRAFT_535554 [Chaetomium strumarium]
MSSAKTTSVPDGDVPQLNTLRHLLTYPAVQDSVRVFKSNPLGRMSIQLSNSAYNMTAPMLSMLNKPYGYVEPYVKRVDELGDQTLSKVEEKFPVVKKPSPELLNEAKQVVYGPVKHVTEVYNGKYQQTSGGYAVASGKAAVMTAAVITGEGLVYAARSLLKWTESLHLGETIKAKVDNLEAAVARQEQNAESQNGRQPKSASS